MKRLQKVASSIATGGVGIIFSRYASVRWNLRGTNLNKRHRGSKRLEDREKKKIANEK